MDARIVNLLTVVIAACAVVTTYTVVNRDGRIKDGPEVRARPKPVDVPEWKEIASVGLRFGADSAAVVITQFSDFQCPYCRRLHAVLAQVANKYPGQVQFVYRHFPLDRIHPYAREAAHAAECAGRYGRFQQLHDLLYTRQDSIGGIPWAEVALRSGLPAADTVDFLGCMQDGAVAARISADSTAAMGIGLTGTPTVLVNNWKLKGAPGFGQLDSLVQQLLTARR